MTGVLVSSHRHRSRRPAGRPQPPGSGREGIPAPNEDLAEEDLTSARAASPTPLGRVHRAEQPALPSALSFAERRPEWKEERPEGGMSWQRRGCRSLAEGPRSGVSGASGVGSGQ